MITLRLERKTRFELATYTMARYCSTIELLSHELHFPATTSFLQKLENCLERDTRIELVSLAWKAKAATNIPISQFVNLRHPFGSPKLLAVETGLEPAQPFQVACFPGKCNSHYATPPCCSKNFYFSILLHTKRKVNHTSSE